MYVGMEYSQYFALFMNKRRSYLNEMIEQYSVADSIFKKTATSTTLTKKRKNKEFLSPK